jgi:hypothetical protein
LSQKISVYPNLKAGSLRVNGPIQRLLVGLIKVSRLAILARGLGESRAVRVVVGEAFRQQKTLLTPAVNQL